MLPATRIFKAKSSLKTLACMLNGSQSDVNLVYTSLEGWFIIMPTLSWHNPLNAPSMV